jgi:hypothetical protein
LDFSFKLVVPLPLPTLSVEDKSGRVPNSTYFGLMLLRSRPRC